jgi:hypothetical protein
LSESQLIKMMIRRAGIRGFGSIKDQIVGTFPTSRPQRFLNEALFLSVAPIAVCASLTLAMPYYDLWVHTVPNIMESTFLYANLHACTIAGTHWGLAASLHENSDSPEEMAFTKRHFMAAAMIPVVLWSSFAATLFMDPRPIRYLISLGVLSFGYLGISVGDKMLVARNRAPRWLFHFRLKHNLFAIFSVMLLCVPFLLFPDKVIKPIEKVEVKSIAKLENELT